MNLGPYDTAKEARIALGAAGYLLAATRPGRPGKWVHPTSRKCKAIRERLDGEGYVIVPYPERLTTRMKVRHHE